MSLKLATAPLALIMLAGSALAQPAGVRFVNAGASAGGNGLSWAGAYTSLSAALIAAATNSDITEIWVARGAYAPEAGADPDAQAATFALRNNLGVYGGFAGTEVKRGQRNPTANLTTLDGGLVNPARVYHVVTATGTDPSAVLDGFTITRGSSISSASVRGAGIYASPGSPTLSGLVVTGNAAEFGAGAYILGDPRIAACRFQDNHEYLIGDGVGLWVSGNAMVEDCIFTGHEIDGGVVWGAGAPVFSRCTISDNVSGNASAFEGIGTFKGCTFRGNRSGISAGAVVGSGVFTSCIFESNSGPLMDGEGGAVRGFGTFVNCLFHGNQAETGGAVYATGPTTLINCTIVANTGMFGSSAVVGAGALRNCILWANGPTRASQVSAGTLGYCTVQFWDGGLPGAGNSGADPLFANVAAQDYTLASGSPCIDAADNSAVPPGILTDLLGHARFFDRPEPNTGLGGNPMADRGCYEASAPVFCYANCDASSIAPVLNVGDFVCFLNRFAAAHPYANCDGSTVPPVLNVADFICFLNSFAAGCS